MSLCERFPDFNPIKVRRYSAHEVFLLIKRLKKHNERSVKDGKTPNQAGVIRKPAGDDWF